MHLVLVFRAVLLQLGLSYCASTPPFSSIWTSTNPLRQSSSIRSKTVATMDSNFATKTRVSKEAAPSYLNVPTLAEDKIPSAVAKTPIRPYTVPNGASITLIVSTTIRLFSSLESTERISSSPSNADSSIRLTNRPAESATGLLPPGGLLPTTLAIGSIQSSDDQTQEYSSVVEFSTASLSITSTALGLPRISTVVSILLTSAPSKNTILGVAGYSQAMESFPTEFASGKASHILSYSGKTQNPALSYNSNLQGASSVEKSAPTSRPAFASAATFVSTTLVSTATLVSKTSLVSTTLGSTTTLASAATLVSKTSLVSQTSGSVESEISNYESSIVTPSALSTIFGPSVLSNHAHTNTASEKVLSSFGQPSSTTQDMHSSNDAHILPSKTTIQQTSDTRITRPSSKEVSDPSDKSRLSGITHPIASSVLKSEMHSETYLPTSFPKAILPERPTGKPSGSVQPIHIGFLEPLNYKVVSSDRDVSNRIFQYLPIALELHPSIKNLEVTSLEPFNTMQNLGYITTIANLQYPSSFISLLQTDICDPHSDLYSRNKDIALELSLEINSSIPLLGSLTNDMVASCATTSSGGDSVHNAFGSSEQKSSPKQQRNMLVIATGATGASAVVGGTIWVFIRRRHKNGSQRRNSRRISPPYNARDTLGFN